MMNFFEHIPVMKSEIEELFSQSAGIVVDATVGAGGHARAILSNNSRISLLVGIDQDYFALQQAATNLSSFSGQVALVHNNFRNIKAILKEVGWDFNNIVKARIYLTDMKDYQTVNEITPKASI